MAIDHYALDVSRAHTLLGWQPKHRLADELPAIVATLKEDPAAWYKANRIPAPMFVSEAEEAGHDPEELRAQHEQWRRAAHADTRWAHKSEEPTSELQSLMRISYAVFCLKTKTQKNKKQ